MEVVAEGVNAGNISFHDAPPEEIEVYLLVANRVHAACAGGNDPTGRGEPAHWDRWGTQNKRDMLYLATANLAREWEMRLC